MDAFIPGQRWISNTESELGLGLILDVSFNRVTVLYLAADERRIYARDNAPLTDRKSTRLNSSHDQRSRMPSSA